MRLFVGQASGGGGDLRRYARRFDFLEVRGGPSMPKTATLKKWVTEVPARFAFSVVLPESIGSLEATAIDQAALDKTLQAAETLGAHWLVVRTPPSARPSARTRRRLEELVARLPREGRRIAWEPRGLWEDEDAEQTAAALGVHLVRDVARSEAPPGDVVYARLRALGGGGRVSSGAVEDAIDELIDKTEAYVVVEGTSAVRAAKMLRDGLGATTGMDEPAGDDYDSDDDDDDDGDAAEGDGDSAGDDEDWDEDD